VDFNYLVTIGKAGMVKISDTTYHLLTTDTFTDKAVENSGVLGDRVSHAGRYVDGSNYYYAGHQPPATTADLVIRKIVAGTLTTLATDSVDVQKHGMYTINFSISGSTLKAYRDGSLRLTVTDTSLSSGNFGVGEWDLNLSSYFIFFSVQYLRAPSSILPNPIAILEIDTILDEQYMPNLNRNLTDEILGLNVPDYVKNEIYRYRLLKSKGFTDDEIRLLFGYIPQHQIDLDSVSWGAFEFSEKSATNIIMVYGDNPYKSGAVQRQIDYVKSKNLRVFTPPKDYSEAVSLYNKLKGDFKHWLAGKDNFAYQVLGWEVLDLIQNVDFYYGELIEHKTHYEQLKKVPDWELSNRLNELKDKLSRVNVLVDERDKHLDKLNRILKMGW
jgi:hypothetical protein